MLSFEAAVTNAGDIYRENGIGSAEFYGEFGEIGNNNNITIQYPSKPALLVQYLLVALLGLRQCLTFIISAFAL